MTNNELHDCISQVKDENAKRILFELMNRLQDVGNLTMTNIVHPEYLEDMRKRELDREKKLQKVN